MDEESSVKLLLKTDNKKTDFKTRKFHQNRVANSLLGGLVLGFVFSFLVAYSGVIEDTTIDNIDYTISDFVQQKKNFTFNIPKNANLGEFLHREVRVLCIMVPMNEVAFRERGDIFLQTWTKRCNKFIFFAEEKNDNFTANTVVLTDKSNNWAKLREALTYIYKHHLNDFDWILKTNDNSYVVMENLRWLLYQYDSDNWPVFIGQRFLKEDYMTGVYAISKTAFVRLIEKGFTNQEICDINASEDDKEISKCLQHLNVLQIDALDDEGKGMFFQNTPESALFPEKFDQYDQWYWHKLQQGPKCCSDRLIAIQNVWNTHLYYLEYFIYKVHAFGRHRNFEPLPRKKTLEEIVKQKF